MRRGSWAALLNARCLGTLWAVFRVLTLRLG